MPRVTVVLLHAFPLDERMWAPQLDALAGFDVAAPRLYGRGRSLDDWAASVLDEVDGELALVGASMGGYVGLAMARRAPDRIRGLMLIGSRAGVDPPERRETRTETARMLREQGVAAWAEGAEELRGLGADELAALSEELAVASEALRDRADATDVVRSLAAPLVLVAGDQDDLLTVDEARGIVGLARAGRLEVIPGAGHLVSLEQPEELNGILLDFLARTGEEPV